MRSPMFQSAKRILLVSKICGERFYQSRLFVSIRQADSVGFEDHPIDLWPLVCAVSIRQADSVGFEATALRLGMTRSMFQSAKRILLVSKGINPVRCRVG